MTQPLATSAPQIPAQGQSLSSRGPFSALQETSLAYLQAANQKHSELIDNLQQQVLRVGKDLKKSNKRAEENCDKSSQELEKLRVSYRELKCDLESVFDGQEKHNKTVQLQLKNSRELLAQSVSLHTGRRLFNGNSENTANRILDSLAQPVQYPTVDTTLADLFTGHGVTVTRNTASVGRSESATRSRASGQSSTTLQADSLSDVSSAGTHRSHGPFSRAYTGPTGSTPGPRGTLGPQTSTNPFREQLYSNIGKKFYT